MARSRRKTPKTGMTITESEKDDKVAAHRRLRVAERAALKAAEAGDEAVVFPELKEVSDPWLMGKDGKHWFDPEQFPKEMRK